MFDDVTITNNGKAKTVNYYKTVTEWLNKGFVDNKSDTALVYGTEKISYEQLDKLSNSIANILSGKGVMPGDRVGICLDRSPQLIASVIAIVKSGAAYVPLDVNYPKERLEIMQEDANLNLLITQNQYANLFAESSTEIALWGNIASNLAAYSDSFTPPNINADDVAYIIFTSGSTGRPKGIEMPHRALANLIDWQLDRSSFRKKARVLQYSSISFDVSFQEIATTLASGGKLVLIDDEERRDPRILLDKLNAYKIERLFIPFVALRSMVEVANTSKKYPVHLKEIITAGEQLRVDSGLQSFFTELSDTVLDNQYGPSETHVVSAYMLGEDPAQWPDLPAIGKPIKNNDIFILDEQMQPVEKGESGELYLAGINLAHGYIGRKDLTEKVFIKNPDILDNRTLYKTGDLGFVNDEGDIEFLGRVDNQIKIRGYRIEPEEINIKGVAYPGVAQCFTHSVLNKQGKQQLVTYYVAGNEDQVKNEEFKAYLSEVLPEYMVPTFVCELDKIPYTPSGKVDLKSLPNPQKQIFDGKQEIMYASDTEEELARIWCDILDFEYIPRSANFFDLGGDSLNAVTLFMYIEERFNKSLPLSILTQAQTINELARVIEAEDHVDNGKINSFRSLQLIQKGSSKSVPLFMVHGGAGNVLMFRDLALGLPSDQTLYAFQWPGWDGYSGQNTILEMAELYKEELCKAHPKGPYLLGGYCIGGIIAMKIAKLLKADGKEVLDPLLVIDAPNIHSKYYRPQEPESSPEEHHAFEELKNNFSSLLPNNGERQKRKLRKTGSERGYSNRRYPLLAKYLPFYFKLGKVFLKIANKLQMIRIRLFPHLSWRLPVKDRKLYCQLTQIEAVKQYPQTIYDGDILYLKSETLRGKRLSIPGWWNDPFFGFQELCNGTFDAHVVGEGHNDVLKSPLSHQIIKQKILQADEQE